MTTWHCDDQFWADFEPVIFPPKQWEAAREEVDGVVKLLDLQPGAAVLDLPCGPGRHSLELARRGYRVTGADRTTRYLDEAREKAAAESLTIEWHQADMREFRRPGAFDALLNLYTSFGYFENAAEDRRVAEHFFVTLKPGGRLIMDLMSKEILARIFQPRDWREVAPGVYCLEERTVQQDWAWIDSRWIVLAAGERSEHHVTHRLYSASELKAVLADVGFTALRAYGSLSGTPYDHEAQRLVMVAEKPA